jgi:hypothetical protein
MRPEDVLDVLGARHELRLAAEGLRRVAGTLGLDSNPVQLLVRRILPEPLHGLPQPVVVRLGRGLEPLALPQRRRLLELLEQRAVATGVECGEQLLPRLLALRVEQFEDAAEGGGLVDRRELVEQVRDQDVAVANLAEQAAEPAQLVTETLCPLGVLEL